MKGSQTLLRPQITRADWETPQWLFDQYHAQFAFTLDVCATADNAKCPRFFTPEVNGLKQDWGKDVCWMNPPYGREIAKWLTKARLARQAGATVVCLLPARTDTAWWHTDVEYAADEKHFLRGRLQFKRTDGKRSQAPFASVVAVYRP